MKKLGVVLIMLCVLFSAPSRADELRLSIGVNLSEYPELVIVPGYPVYYAPQLRMNYFFYDGKYWVYQDDNWFESSWYDGPWWQVNPEDVPDFILRVPLQYYPVPPAFFIGWIAWEPPHWGEHWGRDWERHRRGWDRWDHRIHYKPAPLPLYQKEYSGDKYPRQPGLQHELHQRNYRYRPLDPFVQQQRHQPAVQGAPDLQRERMREGRDSMQQGMRGSVPVQQGSTPAVRVSPPQGNVVREQREVQHEQRARESRGQEERQQETEGIREHKRGQGQSRGQER
jgi:hypothetical protein